MGIDFKIRELSGKADRIFGPSFAYIYIKNSWSMSLKRKIELCMVLLLLIGAIVASKKLSELTANVSKEKNETAQKMEETTQSSGKKKTVIVVDPGHGGFELRQN